MVGKRIAIIPARGGSKRIPKKNILNFFGKPMIALTIEAALSSKCFDTVVVSTDDTEIAEISKEHGAQVPFLRELYNDDLSSASSATLYCLKQAEKFWGIKFSVVAQLMPNCPLRTADDIRSAFNSFYLNKRKSQVSCFKYGWMNPWWAAKLNQKGKPENLFPNALKQRSQDLDALYCPTGAIWIANTKYIKEQKSFYAKEHCFEPISWISAIDIDETEDLEMAKAIWFYKNCATLSEEMQK